MSTTRLQPPDRHAGIAAVEQGLGELARLAADRLGAAVGAWERGDPAAARRVIDGDDRMDALCLAVEHEVFRVQLRWAPVARDARLLHCARVVCVALERVGDLATAVAELAGPGPEGGTSPGAAARARIGELHGMAAAGLRAVRRSIPHGDRDAALRAASGAARARVALAGLVADASGAGGCPAAGPVVLMGRHLERVCDNAAWIAGRMDFVADGLAWSAGAAPRAA